MSQNRRPQPCRTQCSTVSLSGEPSKFSLCEGYHGIVVKIVSSLGVTESEESGAIDCRGYVSISTLSPHLSRLTRDCSVSSVSRWWHAEKATKGNLGDHMVSWCALTGHLVAQPISSMSEMAGKASCGVGWVSSTYDFGDSTTLKKGRGPTCVQGCSRAHGGDYSPQGVGGLSAS
ncbi:MAG: hypothetical protein JRN52_07055 [Nitrososphaerota archaeon]|nr:hypothetical protein [Nitrososphaerota archaeon]